MSLDMTLDDIIATKQKPSRSDSRNGRNGKGGRGRASRKQSGGAERSEGKARAARTSAAPYRPFAKSQDGGDDVIWGLAQGGTGPGTGTAGRLAARRAKNQESGGAGGGSSILSRLGAKMSDASGTKVTVGNLGFEVLEAELKELFQTVGELLDAKVKYDRTGRSLGEGEITFARQSDAVAAVKTFHARALDGQPMQVKLSGVDGKDNPLNPHEQGDTTFISKTIQGGGNAKSELFGTALKQSSANNNGRRGGGKGGRSNKYDEPTFSVILGQDKNRSGGRGGRQRQQRGSERRGGKGGGKGRTKGGKGGKGGSNGKKTLTEDELNAEMEAYMETS
eukprot:CAMPEP_0185771342 /NCGR_PEP_ID=MMETSP1174-20130828/64237_1 /TAXON_ID=35687 /ORGANISM="Dictyocha speculum, Strain CCMP1381" /LENGTH=335 /DNA_ID=CAMNT_0028457193 /DNA_START=132 /DNA_END=1139 /DNA_ORIENTATION=+